MGDERVEIESLTERIEDWHHSEMLVDAETRVVRNVALTGCQSRNGYTYTEQSLRDAVALYENKPVFLDHPQIPGKPHERSTRDYVGMIINPRFDNQRIRGDIRVVNTDSGQTFLALAESAAPGIGMSHVVLAYRSLDQLKVEKIEKVISVDAVVFPATTQTLREQQSVLADSDVTLTEETDPTATHWEEQAKSYKQQLLVLQEQRQREQSIQQMLSRSGLPEFALTNVFREQLLSATQEERKRLIEDRITLLKEVVIRRPESSHRQDQPIPAAMESALIRAIKGH
jgi:hypothetical protein